MRIRLIWKKNNIVYWQQTHSQTHFHSPQFVFMLSARTYVHCSLYSAIGLASHIFISKFRASWKFCMASFQTFIDSFTFNSPTHYRTRTRYSTFFYDTTCVLNESIEMSSGIQCMPKRAANTNKSIDFKLLHFNGKKWVEQKNTLLAEVPDNWNSVSIEQHADFVVRTSSIEFAHSNKFIFVAVVTGHVKRRSVIFLWYDK